jgi:hypothetical protein
MLGGWFSTETQEILRTLMFTSLDSMSLNIAPMYWLVSVLSRWSCITSSVSWIMVAAYWMHLADEFHRFWWSTCYHRHSTSSA